MNRRSFLKSGALWVPPLFAIGRARGAVLTLADPAMVGRTRTTESAATCKLITAQSQETDNDYWGLSTIWSQLLKIGSSMEICQVDLKMYVPSGSASVYVQFRSSPDAGGSQTGTDSQTVTITNTSAEWKVFTWASNPTISSNTYLTIRTSGDPSRIRSDTHASAGSTHYPYTDATDDANYCAYDATIQRGIIDLCFRIYAMQ